MPKKDLWIREFQTYKYVKMLGRSKRMRRIPDEKRYELGAFIYPNKAWAERDLKAQKQRRRELEKQDKAYKKRRTELKKQEAVRKKSPKKRSGVERLLGL